MACWSATSAATIPLVQGSLHEARAQLAWAAGREEDYALSLAKMEQWYRPTGTPALIAKCERLVELASGPKSRDARGSAEGTSTRVPRTRRGAAITTGRLQPAPVPPSAGDNENGHGAIATVAEPRPTRRKS